MRDEKKFRFPNSSQRTTIVGRTGSGKTVFGTWLLSHMDFSSMPWIVFDFKGDKLLSSIPHTKPASLYEPPTEPGLYIIRPHPTRDSDAVDNFLEEIWEQENTGIYIDEGYMIDKDSEAFNAILTQGRSKNIPVICLTQRPTWVSRFVVSEADYFAVFHLNDKRDEKTVEYFLGKNKIDETLDDFNSRWYDVGQHKLFMMQPVPNAESILQRFDEKLKPPEEQKKVRMFI